MSVLKQSTAYTRLFFMVDSADHVTGKTGLTVAVTLSKAGAAFGAAAGVVSELANGWYGIAYTTGDTGTLGDLAVHCSATGADATDFLDQIVAYEGVPKNTALNNFEFLMIDSTDSVTPKTGLTVTAQRSIDGGAFAACANSPVEVGSGIYKINLAATDVNGAIVTFKFTAAGAVARYITVATDV